MDLSVCAHRGSPSVVPENTIGSFLQAVDEGADEVELDLRLSADGRLVVMHDATVDRTTDGTGAVAELTLRELQALDAGGGARIPSFEEVLDGVGPRLRLQVEIKAPEAVGPLAELLRDRPGDLARISPCCFDPDVVAELVRLFPDAPVGLIASGGSAESLDRAVELGASRVLFGWSGTDRALVERAQSHGLEFSVWLVNTPEQLRDAQALGVDGFTTDETAAIVEELVRAEEAAS
ncbi:glycerophosphodiester phosphodiesterase [Jiangella endophytica]|uniref:glycerophosphodiester phosphodiesterase n=1 Tax=Jiangella endophytica TaxID=1623398 RepID=UPI000E350448|nr:glycerophosphodiester phosphodiesterase family protein [Jiangella endophytica]